MWVNTPNEILSDKIIEIVSDTSLIPNLLSLFRSDQMGLCSHVTGLAWTLLQWTAVDKNIAGDLNINRDHFPIIFSQHQQKL